MTVKKKLKRKTQPTGVSYPEVENAIERMFRLQADWSRGREEFFRLEDWVLNFLKEKGIEKYDNGPIVGTPVSGSTAVYDWDGIKKALGLKLWRQILGEPQPDPTKLEALIQLGLVKAAAIDPLITDKPKKTFLKMTRKA